MPERLREFPVVAPDLGLTTHVPREAIPDRAWWKVKNARFRRGKAEKVPGYVAAQVAALDGAVMGLFDFHTTGGFQAWVAVTATKIYKKTPTDASFVDITGEALTGGTTDWADFTVFKDLLVITNGKDAPRRWDGVAATTSALGGSPPVFKRVTTFQNHVMGAWIDPNAVIPSPQKLQWSDLGLAEVWSGGEAGSLSLVDEPSGILEIMPLRDSLIAYKDKAIYLVDYTGFPFTMSTRRLATGTGAISARAVVAVRDVHYYLGADSQVYRVTLAGPEPVGDPVRTELFGSISFKRKDRVLAWVDEANTTIYFAIPVGSDDFPTVAYLLNYAEGKWGVRDDLGIITAASPGGVTQLTDTTWNDVASSWDAQIDSWDSTRTASGAPIVLHGSSAGKVFKHTLGELNADGAAIDCDVESKMYDFGAPGKMKRLERVHVNYELQAGTTLSVYVLTAAGPGVTPTVNGPYNIVLDGSGDQWVDVNLTARYFGFRFRNNSAGQTFALTGYMPAAYVRELT